MTTATKEAYRPRSPETVSPYKMVEHAETVFTAPPMGLDGGILLPTDVVEKEISKRTPLGTYLEQRTIHTGRWYAAHHEPDGRFRMLGSTNAEWMTSRGHPYAEVNFNETDNKTKEERREVLRTNLEEDATLLNHWGNVMDRIRPLPFPYPTPDGEPVLPHETRWRIAVGVLQNMTNDLIGLDYAWRTAAAYNPAFREESHAISKSVFAATTAYYDALLHPEKIPTDATKFALLQQGTELLDAVKEKAPPNIDDIRTNRETDAGYLTLAAAATLKKEFGNQLDKGKPPTIVIPLLGGYDIGPALYAVGYKGKVVYVTPGFKTISHIEGRIKPKRQFVWNDELSQQFPHTLASHPFVVVDDSIGSGLTLMRMLYQLESRDMHPKAIRTMFINDGVEPKPTQYMRLYGDRHASYFDSPLLKKPGSNHELINRDISRKWRRADRAATLGGR